MGTETENPSEENVPVVVFPAKDALSSLSSSSSSPPSVFNSNTEGTNSTAPGETTSGPGKWLSLWGIGALIAVSAVGGLIYYRNRELNRWQEYRTIQLLQAQDEAFDLSFMDDEAFDLELSHID
jgi:hypothetical protein